MFTEILRFELFYRFRRPATYIYFGLMFLLAFGAIAWENLTVGGGTGLVKENAPTVLSFGMVILTAIPGFFICSAIMGVPVLRDFEHLTFPMIFTSPIRKSDYLAGRFAGSMITVLFVFLALPMGYMIGTLMPWLDEEKFLPFHLWHFFQPFFLFIIPNVLISGSLFFMGGALSKKLLFVFVQGVGLLTFYMIGTNISQEMDNRVVAALLDPVGINLLSITSQYWTVSEQNTQLYSLSGLVLWNRIIWLAVATIAYTLTYRFFNYKVAGKNRKKAVKTEETLELIPVSRHISLVKPNITEGFSTNLNRVFSLARLYFAEIIYSIPFIAITLMGIILLVINSFEFNTMYGTDVYPTTYSVLELLSEFNLFFVILIVFYTGELIWRERDLKMDQIYDTLPVPNFVGLAAKFLGFMYVSIVLLTLLLITGILIQAGKGYYDFELPVYLSDLYTDKLIFILLFTLLAFFIQVVANQKYLGHSLIILFFMFVFFLFPEMGLEHIMFRFGAMDLGTFSDMNSYGHFVSPFSWISVYWIGFALVLFALSVVFAIRGTDAILKTRVKLASLRFSRPVIVFTTVALLLFTASGCYIYYNTNVLNEYRNSDDDKKMRAGYEKELKKYQDIPQPRIVETSLEVDIFPYERDFDVKGFYILKNKNETPVAKIHIQHSPETGMTIRELTFSRVDSLPAVKTVISESYEKYKYFVYELTPPLAPGDSLRMDFRGEFRTKGFVEGGSNTNVVFNGTFFNNTYFPSLGYDPAFEMEEDKDREDEGLPKKERMRDRNDPIGQKINLVGDDADHIRFEIKMSTSEDQIAIAPGYLQKEWKEGDRRYFHYKMDAPMFNFYSMLSARYEVQREVFELPGVGPVNLEIYYHKGHEYNLNRMMEGMKHSLTYFSEHFSPYQFRQMRILEFPRYATFAQSYANTVPFSEGIGFIMDIKEDDVDMAYYVTAHEMAHQWWGHQVTEAQVKGNAMLSETMSQYSALMVMKEKYPPEMMQKFLKHELDRYLRGRAAETKKEMPLELVEAQGYIHYRKGSLVMYALQDYISEDSVNAALHRYVNDWAWREDRYVTSDILLDYFRKVTPDSLQYVITDMFETITLFENRTKTATYESLPDGKYKVSLDIETIKYRADSLGNETEIPVNDRMDIGVFGKTSAGKDTLLYLQKHRITGKENHFEIEVGAKPEKAGIDPINKLIDRNPEDNVKTIELKEVM
ncbi:MAG: M1 family aminopeptidase [Bacteroidia bacterium]|nr:M1 family aminopeptidase [Bacteroidia bacterium]